MSKIKCQKCHRNLRPEEEYCLHCVQKYKCIMPTYRRIGFFEKHSETFLTISTLALYGGPLSALVDCSLIFRIIGGVLWLIFMLEAREPDNFYKTIILGAIMWIYCFSVTILTENYVCTIISFIGFILSLYWFISKNGLRKLCNETENKK